MKAINKVNIGPGIVVQRPCSKKVNKVIKMVLKLLKTVKCSHCTKSFVLAVKKATKTASRSTRYMAK